MYEFRNTTWQIWEMQKETKTLFAYIHESNIVCANLVGGGLPTCLQIARALIHATAFILLPLHPSPLSRSLSLLSTYTSLRSSISVLSLSLSVFFATYMPLYLLAPPSLSLSLSPILRSILVVHSILLDLIVQQPQTLCLFLEMNSLSRSSRLSVYIYNDTGYIFCLRFFLQAIASFFPS